MSRAKSNDQTISYKDLDKKQILEHELIINCSPLGTYPDVNAKPNLPYEFLTERHLLFDLIYNPEMTAFLKMGLEAGAIVKNGSSMLKHQADRAWEIWNS